MAFCLVTKDDIMFRLGRGSWPCESSREFGIEGRAVFRFGLGQPQSGVMNSGGDFSFMGQ